MQFGTGGFLRAFADFFIDEANHAGMFNGRVVVVGSTGSRRIQMLNDQGGLYTVRTEGLRHGEVVEELRVVGAISRALSAANSWTEVIDVAKSPDLELVISNTTEVGIVYDAMDSYSSKAPASFPGKLTAVLFERGRHFDFADDKGLVVLPCELISNNGDALKSIVLRLVQDWQLGEEVVKWINQSVHFCNTLVDRIVPGTPSKDVLDEMNKTLGYTDSLLLNAEVYRLWPIEGSEQALDRITFAEADSGVVLTDDVHPYKERKVRILNGTHTSTVPIAFLAGEETVLSMMNNPTTQHFVRSIMMEEIVPSLDVPGGKPFAEDVLDRFSNPFLRHRLIDITLQSTSKWRLRLLPSIKRYYEKHQALPRRICAGFAAYVVFMRGLDEKEGIIYGEWDGVAYPIRDDQAPYFKEAWKDVALNDRAAIGKLITALCAHEPFWGDTLQIPGFGELVHDLCWHILTEGPIKTIEAL